MTGQEASPEQLLRGGGDGRRWPPRSVGQKHEEKGHVDAQQREEEDEMSGSARGALLMPEMKVHGGGTASSGGEIGRPGGERRGGELGKRKRGSRGICRSKDGRGQGLHCRKSGRGSPEVLSRVISGEEDEGDVSVCVACG